MWSDNSVFYQIYPLGLCGAPAENDGVLVHRLPKLLDWLPHIERLGADALYLCPVFDSDRHGYDTRDYRRVDPRLGDEADLRKLVEAAHARGIRVVLDGVFNHVGRGFWAFRDVQARKWDSPYKDWFQLRFDGNSPYGDGFWYEGWEGHYELVKLNLRNPQVADYLLDCVKYWVETFGIDGLRLDVAYCLDPDFLGRLRRYTMELKPGFFLVGETLHGDYNRWVNEGMLHSCTNYECYKGLYSAFNSMNLFEIVHSLKRQFGPEPWTLYKGKHLLCFADNHDVSRIASILNRREHLIPLYGLLFGMPGIPCLYYGSEWGLEGRKDQGDAALWPALEKPEWNSLTERLSVMAKVHRSSPALCRGDFRDLALTNKQTVFQRCAPGEERILVAVNADEAPYFARFDAQSPGAVDLLTGKRHQFHGGLELPGYSVLYLRCD